VIADQNEVKARLLGLNSLTHQFRRRKCLIKKLHTDLQHSLPSVYADAVSALMQPAACP
jgi:hypothetical protein